MIAQFDNRLMSAFLLKVDHEVLSRGLSYTNFGSRFFPIQSHIQGVSAYAAPYKQLCNDVSISGANIMSGVYVNNNFVTIGQSGLSAINHYQGAVYFSGSLPSSAVVSGNYSIKDFSVELTDQPETKLLFETKFVSAQSVNQAVTGLPLDTRISPAIFIRTKNDENVPFALGGMDDRTKRVRAIVIADSEYQRTAVCSILRNMAFTPFYLVNSTPFDQLGNMTGINYNYNNLNLDSTYFPWIMKVKVLDAPRHGQFKDVWKNVSLVDFELSTVAKHV